jgi:hypothetical protein
MPAQTRRSNRTGRAAELNEQQQQPKLAAVPDPSETPKPAPSKPKPEPKPLATVDLGARPVTYWFPKATVEVDGKTVELVCPHARYGHESEASAKRCISQLVNQHGGRVS